MDRRAFNQLGGFAAPATASRQTALSGEELKTQPSAAAANEVVLRDEELLVAFDSASGALKRMEDKSTHWIIQRRPQLGVSFRLHAPLANRRDNLVLCSKQKAVAVEKVSDYQIRLQWKDLVSEHGGVMPITLETKTTRLTN